MIPEHLRVVDECELYDVRDLISDVMERLQHMKIARPAYVELGPAMIYLSKANDMLDLAIQEVRS